MKIAGLKGIEGPFDGIDLSPALFQTDTVIERRLYWEYGDKSAMRMGPWKILQEADESAVAKLFNMDSDLAKTEDISSQYPARMATMIALLDAWKADVRNGATLQPAKRTE